MNHDTIAPSTNDDAQPAASHQGAIYFTFKDFLSEDDQRAFFRWPHAAQVAKVTEYLAFIGRQPAAAQFTSSRRASTSSARLRAPGEHAAHCEVEVAPPLQALSDVVDDNVLASLLTGRAKSGFGASGTEPEFLPQLELSLAVANVIEEIGHEYVAQGGRRSEHQNAESAPPPVLNSRSFFLNWCHAEKQKTMDIRRKLDAFVGRPNRERRRAYWERLVVTVDRPMCPDCVEFAHCMAAAEGCTLVVADPEYTRVFPPSKLQDIESFKIND